MLYKKRKHFDKLGRKIGLAFSKIPLSPNQWTIMGLVLILITFYFLIIKDFLTATFFFIFTTFFDMIDGAVARSTRRVTKFGAYLDTIVDRLIEFISISGLFFIDYPDFFLSSKSWLLFLLFGSLMTTYIKASAFEKGLVRKELKGGILEHTDRLILLFLIILISIFSLKYASYLIVITAILVNFSALQRFLIATKNI